MSDPVEVLKQVLKDDLRFRTTKSIEDAAALMDYYKNRAGKRTKQVNDDLGVGLLDVEHRPLQVGLLRYAIDRQGVMYSRPPTRWLMGKDGKRQASDSAQTILMRDVYERSLINTSMHKVDRLSNLLQVVGVRVYVQDDEVVLRVFTPDSIRRSPSDDIQTDIRRDKAFALKLAGGATTAEADKACWEVWEPLVEGWQLSVVENGELKGASSFSARLPFMLFYTELQDMAWPAMRDDRLAAAEAINAMANDLWANVRSETHSTRFWRGVAPEDVPAERGPGKEIAIENPNVDVKDLNPRPQIDSSVGVQQQVVGLYLVGEDLPPDDLDRNKQVVTGAALRTRLFGLIEKRQGNIPMARGYERKLFDIIRSQWNRQCTLKPGLTPLDEDTTVDIEFAAVDLPVDALQQVTSLTQEIELRIKSRVEAVQQARGCSREDAVKILAQVKVDEAFELSNAKTLDGKQVISLLDVIQLVVQQAISYESGVEVLRMAFGMEDPTARKMLGPMGFTPAIPVPPPPATPAAQGLDKQVKHGW